MGAQPLVIVFVCSNKTVMATTDVASLVSAYEHEIARVDINNEEPVIRQMESVMWQWTALRLHKLLRKLGGVQTLMNNIHAVSPHCCNFLPPPQCKKNIDKKGVAWNYVIGIDKSNGSWAFKDGEVCSSDEDGDQVKHYQLCQKANIILVFSGVLIYSGTHHDGRSIFSVNALSGRWYCVKSLLKEGYAKQGINLSNEELDLLDIINIDLSQRILSVLDNRSAANGGKIYTSRKCMLATLSEFISKSINKELVKCKIDGPQALEYAGFMSGGVVGAPPRAISRHVTCKKVPRKDEGSKRTQTHRSKTTFPDMSSLCVPLQRLEIGAFRTCSGQKRANPRCKRTAKE